MKISTHIFIAAPRAKVWETITQIADSATFISAIQKVEVLHRPEEGLLGFKWRETRQMFGKTATETMWITACEENSYYDTRAESHGAIYTSHIALEDQGDGCVMRMDFSGEPQSMGAKIMQPLLGFMFKGATRKAIQQDLVDIKNWVESRD